jgi:hypothetical protein
MSAMALPATRSASVGPLAGNPLIRTLASGIRRLFCEYSPLDWITVAQPAVHSASTTAAATDRTPLCLMMSP